VHAVAGCWFDASDGVLVVAEMAPATA